MRIVKRVALGCLLLVAIPVLLALLGTLIPNPFVESDKAPRDRHILVISNTIHTDIAIPLDAQTLAEFGFLADAGLPLLHPDAHWLLLGWGGRSFYLETPSLADIKPGPTFRALTLDSSVMHVDVWSQIAEDDPAVTRLAISEAGYARLLASMSQSFARKQGQVEVIEGFAFGPNDKFFEAEGSFNALLGCNLWTSRMLRSAGITTGIWNPLPFLLTASLRLFNDEAVQAMPPG